MTTSLIEKGRMYFDNLFDTDVEIRETTEDTVCVLDPTTKNKHLYGKEHFAAQDSEQDKRFTPKHDTN